MSFAGPCDRVAIAWSHDLSRAALWLEPRLSGRSWQTEALKPENECSFSPILSVENGMKWIWISGLASRASVLKKAPAVPAAMSRRNSSRRPAWVRLQVAPPQTAATAQLLDSLQEVTDVHRSQSEPGLLYVSTNDAASAIPTLLAAIQDKNIDVKQAERYVPPFDDVFIELMTRSKDNFQ